MAPTPQPYQYAEFPRVVYGPDGETKTIASEDERPAGWSNERGGYTPSEDPALPAPKTRTAKAKAAADAREAELRASTIAFLDEHMVDYAADAPIETLTDLAGQLEKVLEDGQAPK